MEILLADDNRELRETTREMLEGLGHEVVPAADGRAALELARAVGFDLLLTDLSMPGMDGLALAERFLETARRHRRPVAVVMISSDADYPGLGEWLAGGRATFVRKPFSAEDLLRTVDLAGSARCLPASAERPPPEPSAPAPVEHPVPGPSEARRASPRRASTCREPPRRASTRREPPRRASTRREPALAVPARRGARFPAWGLAAAAGLAVLVATSVSLLDPPGPGLPTPPAPTASRSVEIELLEPAGPIAALPAAFRWRPAAGAGSYRVTVRAVDGTLLWRGDASAGRLEPPLELLAELHPQIAYTWTVEALDVAGTRVAWSRPIRFRVLTPDTAPATAGPPASGD